MTPRTGPRGKHQVLLAGLRNTPLFAYATDRELRNVAKSAHQGYVDAGVTLMHEGDSGDRFFVVLDGTVRVTRNGRKVCDLGPGKGFGELALLLNAPRSATVTTTSETEVVSIDRKTFATLLDESPAFSRRLLHAMATRLREADANDIQ